MSKTMTARALYMLIWYISFPSSAKQQREMTSFKGFLGTGNIRRWIFLSLPKLSAVPTNSVPGQFGHNRQLKRVGIIAHYNRFLQSGEEPVLVIRRLSNGFNIIQHCWIQLCCTILNKVVKQILNLDTTSFNIVELKLWNGFGHLAVRC